MSLASIIHFQNITDMRGDLFALEELRNIPFAIKRIYYLVNTPQKVSRGFHAHKNLDQVLICLSGSCKVVIDNGTDRETVLLDACDRGLLIRSYIWREMHDFSDNCVLLVVASEYYDESDYIRDYQEFLKVVKNADNT